MYNMTLIIFDCMHPSVLKTLISVQHTLRILSWFNSLYIATMTIILHPVSFTLTKMLKWKCRKPHKLFQLCTKGTWYNREKLIIKILSPLLHNMKYQFFCVPLKSMDCFLFNSHINHCWTWITSCIHISDSCLWWPTVLIYHAKKVSILHHLCLALN